VDGVGEPDKGLVALGRIRCDACAHEYLLASSCKSRNFCPSCHAKRLARWTLCLDETLLAPVPHRQVNLTIPKRLRSTASTAGSSSVRRSRIPGGMS